MILIDMAVAQRRTSKTKKGKRRSHHALKLPTITFCSKCGKSIKPHCVCSYCGYYNGKKIINV